MKPLRNEKGQLLPGQVLNPTGRPPLSPELRHEANGILSAATPRAAQRLTELMEDPDPRIALLAAQAVLDRTMGKPLQQADVKVTTSVQSAHLAVLLELQRKRDHATHTIESQPAGDGASVPVIDVTPAIDANE